MTEAIRHVAADYGEGDGEHDFAWFLAVVFFPLATRMGVEFEQLRLRDPGPRDIRSIFVWFDLGEDERCLGLKGHRGQDGIVEVVAAGIESPR